MDLDRLRHNWECFINQGVVNPDVNPIVAQSWEKCRLHGVDPNAGLGKTVDEHLFNSITKENKSLIETATPVMQAVFELVEKSHFWLVLTDSVGYVLDAYGDTTIHAKAKNLRFERGSLWSDLEVGSNAVGVALYYDTPIQMIGPEHFCRSHHSWTCSAAPIHGLDGEIIGCMNMSGSCEDVHPHTLGLVMTAALGIETQLLSKHSARLMQLSLDGTSDSMIVLDSLFRPVWANLAARGFLGMDKEEVAAIQDFRPLLPDVDWEDVQEWSKGEQYFTSDTRLTVNGKTQSCSATISPTLQAGYTKTFSITLKRQEQVIHSVNIVSGNRATYSFDNIYTANAAMRKTKALAQKYSRYDGVVLIQGESGTGKELFAQAIHNASDRAGRPFVAINCASLPRDLVESELFGYEKGAFTGAYRDGNPGKFELADHGTIFLDEIGELPLEFQAKLLRIVETRMVRRLGGNSEKRLNVRIIAATNRNLRAEVDEGRFRDDLFFRLNVLWLIIPPLRERPEDIAFCAEKFLEHFNRRYPEQRKGMNEDFKNSLDSYDWPGNVRELQNCIERAFYSCPGDTLTGDDVEGALGVRGETRQDFTADEDKLLEQILDSLRRNEGNVEEAARQLRLSRASLYRHIKKFRINPKDYR